MSNDEKYKKRLIELKPLIFGLQAAIELFGRDMAKTLARLALDKYAEDRFVAPFEQMPADKRWETFRNNIIHNADDLEYSVEKHSENMIKVKYQRCLFYEIFRDYGLEDFVPLYCRTDFVTAAKIHPDITLARTQTIASGAPYCNHCWTYKAR
jgi:hypothetical protein